MCYNEANIEILYTEIEDTGYRRSNGVSITFRSLHTDLALPPHRHIDLTILCDKFNVT